LLAASCSVPFVGTAIGFALSRGSLGIGLIFGALGVGMAVPFLAVAIAPGLVAWLPRPGPWMGWLGWVLGLALPGTAAWLLSVLALEAGLDTTLLVGGVLVVLLVLLACRQALAPAGLRRQAIGVAAIILTTAAVLVPALGGQAMSIEVQVSNATAGP
jgi:suppressor for copper-sensitivity B